jgi:hypothetical protein
MELRVTGCGLRTFRIGDWSYKKTLQGNVLAVTVKCIGGNGEMYWK